MIPASDISHEVVFTHIDNVDGVERHFAVERMQKYLDQINYPISLVAVDKNFAHFCRVNRGIEQHRLDRIKISDLAKYPIIMGSWPDGTTVTFDGHHRYVKAAMLNIGAINARILPESIWRQFQIADGPTLGEEFLKTKHSGIL